MGKKDYRISNILSLGNWNDNGYISPNGDYGGAADFGGEMIVQFGHVQFEMPRSNPRTDM